ncbi:MAG: TonB-dependent receptor [Spirosoma sp.]|nr:TonB-dependent receptor [Spirosoma sp.]
MAQSATTPPTQDNLAPPTLERPAKGKAKITGYALDSTMTRAVEFANVALYDINSGQLVDGTVADEKGKFSFSRLAPGSYRLLISFLGYNARTVDHIVLDTGGLSGHVHQAAEMVLQTIYRLEHYDY